MSKFNQSYTEGFSSSPVSHRVVEETVRDILKITKKELKKPASKLSVLDVGSGWGEYSFAFAKHIKNIVGVEPYDRLYFAAVKKKKEKRQSNVRFYNSMIENFNSKEKFDLVISLTTIEHMPMVKRSFRKIFDLMKEESLLYVTAPNKLWPLEPHYRLPLLSYLPLSLGNLYLRLTKRGSSFKDSSYALTYSQTRKLFDMFPWKYEFIVPSPSAIYLGCGEDSDWNKMIKKIGINLIRKFPFMWMFSKGFIVAAKKNKK